MLSRGNRWKALAGALILVAGAALLPAAADLPRLSAGLGTGAAGLFHQKYTADAPHSTGWGRYTGGTWWGDLSWSFRSRVTLGLQAHLLRVPLSETRRLGTLDLLPCAIQLGYFHPGLTERLRCFATAGAGMGWARFIPAPGDSQWTAIEISRRHPLVLTLSAGFSYELNRDFLAELGFSSVFMNTEIEYRQAPASQSGGGMRPALAYSVAGRHVLVRLGLRWWFEWW